MYFLLCISCDIRLDFSVNVHSSGQRETEVILYILGCVITFLEQTFGNLEAISIEIILDMAGKSFHWLSKW